MILLNTTYVVNMGSDTQFLDFLKNDIVVDMKKAGVFENFKLRLVYTDDEATKNYCLQAECANSDILEQWMMMNSKSMILKLRQKFGTSVLSFATVLEDLEI